MRIASVGTAFPPHRYPQAVITEALKERMQDKLEIPAIMNRLHSNCGVDYRHIMFPLDTLGARNGFGPNNDLWIKGALELGQQAIQKALDHVGLTPSDISAIFFTSVTGIACPSIDARLVNLMGFPSDIKRTPIFGLGCVAGAAGISRVADYVKAYPKQYALLGAVLPDLAGRRLLDGEPGSLRAVWRRCGRGRDRGRGNRTSPAADQRKKSLSPRNRYTLYLLPRYRTSHGLEHR